MAVRETLFVWFSCSIVLFPLFASVLLSEESKTDEDGAQFLRSSFPCRRTLSIHRSMFGQKHSLAERKSH